MMTLMLEDRLVISGKFMSVKRTDWTALHISVAGSVLVNAASIGILF